MAPLANFSVGTIRGWRRVRQWSSLEKEWPIWSSLWRCSNGRCVEEDWLSSNTLLVRRLGRRILCRELLVWKEFVEWLEINVSSHFEYVQKKNSTRRQLGFSQTQKASQRSWPNDVQEIMSISLWLEVEQKGRRSIPLSCARPLWRVSSRRRATSWWSACVHSSGCWPKKMRMRLKRLRRMRET